MPFEIDVLHADMSTALLSPSQQQTSTKSLAANDITEVSSTPIPGASEPLACKAPDFLPPFLCSVCC